MATSMPPTWLGAIIKECRKIIRVFKWRERKAETDCIIEKMSKHPGSAGVVAATDRETLESIVQGGLAVADHVDDELKKNTNLMTGQPEEQAARFVAGRLGIHLE